MMEVSALALAVSEYREVDRVTHNISSLCQFCRRAVIEE